MSVADTRDSVYVPTVRCYKLIMETKPDNSVTLSLPGGVKICLPRPIRNLTTFVVREQGDWFEDEIKFLRRYLKPGMKVIDIGANYGVYTLSLAKAVGESGQVWAFEPASATAGLLQESAEVNGFDHVEVIPAALSNRTGEATFNIAPSAELNSLAPVRDGVATETVSLMTLDGWTSESGIDDVDFIKLDAEGEESRILEAAGKFLGKRSPLIMFELKHRKQVNLPLIQRFQDLGFETYRLVPGIAKLVPFDPRQAFDPYLLNLFACKPALADTLAEQNVLVRSRNLGVAPANLSAESRRAILERVRGAAFAQISRMPFFEKVSNSAEYRAGDGGAFEQMLDCYVASRNPKLAASLRHQLLQLALAMSRDLTRGGAGAAHCPIEQAGSHARIARDAGEQNRAVQILLQAISSNEGVTALELKLPFLPAVSRYDRMSPGDRLNRWLISSVVEQYVRDHAYSTYFTARKALPALQRLGTLGFIGPSMRRRLKLVSSLKPVKETN